jgi:hypothetical protein
LNEWLVQQTDDLIESLAAELRPVQRLRAPALRALGWLLTILVGGSLIVWRYADMTVFMHRMAVPRVALELTGSALTAITAVIAAFELSIPGRRSRWGLLPVAPFLLWLGASGLGCLANGLGLNSAPSANGESAHCFMFIAGTSLPLALALFWMLRRARPIAPTPVAAFGTLGVAAMAASLLQFFHPFDITVIDLGFHVAAVGFVMLIGTALRRPMLATP